MILQLVTGLQAVIGRPLYNALFRWMRHKAISEVSEGLHDQDAELANIENGRPSSFWVWHTIHEGMASITRSEEEDVTDSTVLPAQSDPSR